MLPLFSQGTRHFNYYPFVSSGKLVKTKTDCCTEVREISSNHPEIPNPTNLEVNRSEGWDGYILTSTHGNELWQCLDDKEIALYDLLQHDRIIQPLGNGTVTKILQDNETQEKCVVIPVPCDSCPIGDFDCLTYEIDFWITEIINIGETLNYMAQNGICFNSHNIYDNCSFSEGELKITSLHGGYKSTMEESQQEASTAMCLLLFYVLSHYFPHVKLGPLLLTEIGINLNFESDGTVRSSFDEVVKALQEYSYKMEPL